MPRQARKKSSTGIYHIMLRGINGQQIFEADEDYTKFLQILKDCKETSGYELYAYCLMGNHIHLLIYEKEEPLEQIFKRIGSKYVYWYNVKYGRKGHLFQDRFKSEPVEDDSYLLTAIRYIHQNPVKAGISKHIDDYKYSSFGEYISESDLIDKDTIYRIIPSKEFVLFNRQHSLVQCLDVEENKLIRVTDEQAKQIISKISKCNSIADFQSLDIKTRDKYLKKFKDAGVSIRQISRLTGISYYVIQKISQS